MKKSAEVLQHHFDLERLREPVKDQNRMDNARVNLGIVLANQKIESYKHMVLNDFLPLIKTTHFDNQWASPLMFF